MTQLKSEEIRTATSVAPPPEDDPLARLHKMSTTAGLGTTDYVAINPMAVASVILGAASAIALLDNLLLAVPILAVIVSIISLRQVSKSGGTQTGRGLAVLGLLLALGFSGVVLARSLIQHAKTRGDEQQTFELVQQLSDDVTSGKYEQAYALMSEKFRARVQRPEWDQRWDSFHSGKTVGKLQYLKSNGRVQFETMPTTGETFARGVAIIAFEGTGTDRLDVIFRKAPDGKWEIDALPAFFPDQRARR